MKTSGQVVILGIDVGSVSVAMVGLTREKALIDHAYEFHHGRIETAVERILERFDLEGVEAVAATASTPGSIMADARFNSQIAVIAAARHLHKRVGTILHVGAEKFGLILFDENQRYLGYRTNTSCAAGTGGFLDQQAGRLNLPGIERLAAIAAANRGMVPKIASRCAVFAKTDLIHAQQEGYGMAEICDGLCQGLAKNIGDTLFRHQKIRPPLVFCGGVARNPAVVRHLRDQVGMEIRVDPLAPFYGALGAAVSLIDKGLRVERPAFRSRRLLGEPAGARTYGYDPLVLKDSEYPSFQTETSHVHRPENSGHSAGVEVDLYEPLPFGQPQRMYLGVDIGSTSTKGVWMRTDKTVLAGFYTMTAGRPVEAMRALFEAMDHLAASRGIGLEFAGLATTGSGRKFVGNIAGADRIIDEITAHARAARELDPDVDTIIEIGGQDSKFTTLRQGRVTFAVMNTVCAAGTGSFIEEQSRKLDCPLSDYADRVEKVRSPIASDRCTVFMERDINDYLSRGYSVDEVLAAALHAVRENYLSKVAVPSAIGDRICFQGATARNRALVASFEQQLGKPIFVSRFCHLTGALGAALHLVDEQVQVSRFRGLDLYKLEIDVRSEICSYCRNHCKVTVADMPDGPVAYGFLCGRDYDTRRFVANNRSGFDLYQARKKAFAVPPSKRRAMRGIVGLPDGLYMAEELSLWTDFFQQLDFQVLTSRGCEDPFQAGKSWVGAEFCAPVTALHGHTTYLLDRCDYIFLPFYLDNREKDENARRQYCYYSQYAPVLTAAMNGKGRARLISPLIRYLYNIFHVRLELFRALRRMGPNPPSFLEIAAAFEKARSGRAAGVETLKRVYTREKAAAADICVLLLGRPYSVLDRRMNKKIPDIFAAMGVKCFFQDMLDCRATDLGGISPFLSEVHWNYAADIIKGAQTAARTDGLYPVLITSFKCSPDSFIRDVFKELLDAADKPYLMVELDEHGSSVGYETRIEAAVRAFRNHRESGAPPAASVCARINPVKVRRMTRETLVLPNWDPITCPLLAANLQREGIDARVMTETPGSIRRSMRLNSGQCIPINAMVQGFVDHVRQEGLDPVRTLLWTGDSEVACNIRLYPYQMQKMIDSFGAEMAGARVYAGSITFTDVSIRAAMNTYFAFMFGGLVRKMGCKIRPYEVLSGETDRVVAWSTRLLEEVFRKGGDKESAVAELTHRFAGIRTRPHYRPKAAIFGDLYARDNPVFNQNLIACIEANGGEAVTTPYTDYIKMIAPAYFRKWFTEGKYFNMLLSRTILAAMMHQEKTYSRYFARVLQIPDPVYDAPPEKILSAFGIIRENTGESMDNILKIYYLWRHHPDLSLFVQTNPAFCCPSLVTEAMAGAIEARTGIPVVPITYDGTGGDKNEKIIPYLQFARTAKQGAKTREAVRR